MDGFWDLPFYLLPKTPASIKCLQLQLKAFFNLDSYATSSIISGFQNIFLYIKVKLTQYKNFFESFKQFRNLMNHQTSDFIFQLFKTF